MTDHDWMRNAACRGTDLVLFFGPDGEQRPDREIREANANQVCARCPVKVACGDYAVTRPERYGTWGGTNETDRADERRRRLHAAEAVADEKVCTGCGEVKPRQGYYRDPRRIGGLTSRCRACSSRGNSDSRKRRREAVA